MTVTINGEKGILVNGAYTEQVHVESTGASAYAVDPANGTLQRLTFTSAVTLNLSGIGEGQGVSLLIVPTSTITWPAGIITFGSNAPAVTAGEVNAFSVARIDGDLHVFQAGVMGAVS